MTESDIATGNGATVGDRGGRSQNGPAGKPLDRRSRRTQTLLQSALLKLLETKPLNRISVRELTELADVNRATFYVHYTDIYAIFEQIKRELVDSYKGIIARHREEILRDDYAPLIRDIFTFAATDESTSLLVVGRSGDTLSGDLIAAIGAYCNELIDPIAAAHTDRGTDGRTAAAVRDYHFAYLAAGVIGVLKEWYRRGRVEPVDLAADIAAGNTHMLGFGMLARNIASAEAGDAVEADSDAAAGAVAGPEPDRDVSGR
ncbi:TetR/AcrR family transcriptional regulator [Bifidobacterium sp. MA2]|uniref:TetR/AcrR family transcriptional regulator n=1 Tax=Bifidobacterium santillanense TaxID=2809028 RepID=A0ABS5UR06_9BIFI|nr:TetR family transcriptional regulator [Bifidobacterium santillanense]MBT1173394.1 TetR/AcrR family transcriptional regulator [Bifidobacterium santillanense]